jgi:adenylate cyclase
MLESNLLVTVRRWKQVLLTILTVAGVAIAASGFGLFHHQEWSMLDLFFRWRPGEPIDPRIVLVTIDESDIGRIGQWPLPNPVLDELLETLKSQHPRAIGLDLYQEFPNPTLPEREDDRAPTQSVSPPILSHNPLVDRLDFPVDSDGRVRRSWISVRTESGERDLNFGLQLSLKYLESDGITLEPLNDRRSRYRLGQTVLVPLSGNDGDYLWGNDSQNRLLMNYRGTHQSFHRISLSDVLDGKISPQLMRDRLIIVGAISARWSPSFYTPYSNGFANTPQRTSELVIHANIASQILSAALDGRPMLKALSEPAKGLWILFWSSIGVAVSLTWLQAKILEENLALKLAVLSFGLVGIGMVSIAINYLAFLRGWWLPASAPISALIGSAVAISIAQIHELQQEKTDLELILETANAQGDLIPSGLLEKYPQEVALESYTTAMQLMDVLPVGIAFIDTNGTVCYTNTRAQQLLGREPTRPISSEEIPEFYQIYLAGTDRLYPYEEFTGLQALQGKSMRADDMEIRNNNKIVPLECWGTPIYDDRGNIQYAILVLQDITDRRQAYAERILFHQELETKTIALQEMEQLKDEFLKRTSHELRTLKILRKAY